MKTLVIAEKPDMGRNIAAVIEPKAANKRTHLEGERYIITWAIGHLIGLAEPDHYDAKYKKWNIDHLPIIPQQFKLIPNYKTRDQLKVIQELAKRCDRLVNACDAGREGQHIFSLIQQYLRLKQPVKRLWISDLTAETIRAGFENMKDASEFMNLTKAAKCRSEADWLIGMNGSRAFTTKHQVLLSVGRVQTPVLALIYDRYKLIQSFASLRFFEVEAHFAQGSTLYKGLWQGERITDQPKADAIAAAVRGKQGSIKEYDVKDTKEFPFRLYDLTLLQREANARYGFSAKKTLDVAQALYEKHKVISYPRTNSNYVNEQNIAEMHRALDSFKGTFYDSLVQGSEKKLVHKNNKGVCNPSKVEDHHAILPTNKKPGSLSTDEQKIYDLIVRRFLSHFYSAAEYKVHSVLTEVAGHTFKTTVKQLLALGWKVIYADQKREKGGKRRSEEEEAEEEAETKIPFILDANALVQCTEAAVKEKETQPPKPFTEGTLLKAMESAGKQIEDEELREAIKDSGLGTPATRAATIERLKQVGYIEMQGKRIEITSKGRTAVELIRGAGIELLTSPEMTGQWERRLHEISRGSASDQAFMENIKKFAALIVDKVRTQQRAAKLSFEDENPSAKKKASSQHISKDASAHRVSKDVSSQRVSRNAKTASAPQRSKKTGNASVASTATREQAATNPEIIALCPRESCGGHIFMGRKGYGCSNYRTGCKFVIWKTSHGKKLTDSMVKSILEKGRTNRLKHKDESGESKDAYFVLTDPNTGALKVQWL